MINDDDKYLMSSVNNTLEILDLLSLHDELGVSEISKATNFGKASVFRMLYTLEKKGFVHKTSDSKYKLGIKFAHFGAIVLEKQNIFTLIRPFLQKLRDKHNETTHLGILDSDLNVIFMVKEASNNTIQMASRVGYKLPFYATAMGKVLVASKLSEELEERLKNYDYNQFTEHTITNHEKLIEMLKLVEQQGYSEDDEESEYGLVCFAAPIKDLTGQTIAAISISGTYMRMNNNKEELIKSIKETAYEVSASLGYKEN
ncbi:IclR family transcriptional regulator [Sedimentibacter hydroxybenzoicus DSM 7310]|uniref:IclR family transcriptional regulator n=1 Tax=Sedimentibacter hydroxybenzoicus DSM 7310 TaxID=1123245 RepID=A0A974GY45_SEDHY|nr:IclR family transcriptional regulator [Sedimentibacter hydroxybenzoicus]NYB75846.1 IclR family transcriptional regulator [Sedimentibacter hydroxybenzoicus DSM 7310]